ncbi:MAG: hypothetical protein JRN08_07965, partial [Nitrososphaerota archaeon]|nr:hypothetical protein [Nitrososphaerota archaeon]
MNSTSAATPSSSVAVRVWSSTSTWPRLRWEEHGPVPPASTTPPATPPRSRNAFASSVSPASPPRTASSPGPSPRRLLSQSQAQSEPIGESPRRPKLARIFVYDGRQIPDPDPRLSVDEVRKRLADFFPELTNSDVHETKQGD